MYIKKLLEYLIKYKNGVENTWQITLFVYYNVQCN